MIKNEITNGNKEFLPKIITLSLLEVYQQYLKQTLKTLETNRIVRKKRLVQTSRFLFIAKIDNSCDEFIKEKVENVLTKLFE